MTIHQPGAHLDHMLRQTRIHHVQLSSMADLKANMLLTLAALVLTFTAPSVTNATLRWPALVMMFFCLITIVLAIYAVMPKVPFQVGAITDMERRSPTFNLLFFGDFVQMPYEQFEGAMEKLLNDPNQLYEAQVREIYTLGTFLAKKKYRFLRLAYLAFLAGLLASAGAFALTAVFCGRCREFDRNQVWSQARFTFNGRGTFAVLSRNDSVQMLGERSRLGCSSARPRAEPERAE